MDERKHLISDKTWKKIILVFLSIFLIIAIIAILPPDYGEGTIELLYTATPILP